MPWVDDDPEVEQERAKARQARLDGAAPPWPNGVEPLAPIDPVSLDGIPMPSRQWLITSWLPMARPSSLYGGGEGKTLLAQMLATACAIGAKWLGMSTRRCNSLLFFCEDDVDEMHRRQADINQHYGCNFADLSAMRWLPRLGENNVLMVFDSGRAQLTPLFDQVLNCAKEHSAGLVVTDTLADVFPGNENDRSQARQFAQSALGHLARQTGCASLTLAHPSLAGLSNSTSGSGSTTWMGTFRSQLYLESPKAEEGEAIDPDVRVLRRAKANFARRDETVELKWKDGVFIPLHPPTGILGSIKRHTCERVFLDLVDATTREGQAVSANSRSGNFAPRLFSKRPREQREGFRRADFEFAMQQLFARREIIVMTCLDAYRHSREYIARSPAPGAAGPM
jgi:RecA-family ATPase